MDMRFSQLSFIDKMFVSLVVCFVFSIPLNNSFEVYAMLRGELEWKAWSTPLTPIYIKLIKDFFIFCAIFLAFLKLLNKQWLLSSMFYGKYFFFVNLFVAVFFFVTLASLGSVPFELIVYGVRGYWVVLLVYVGACFYNTGEYYLRRSVFVVFFVHLLFQIIETVLGSGYAVFAEFRNPGIFIIPATAGGFSLFVFYLAEKQGNRKIMAYSVFSLLLSTSTMGLMVFLSYLFIKLLNRFRGNFPFQATLVFFFIFIGAWFFINLDWISGRGDAVYLSMFTRLSYIFDVLADFSELTWGLGMGVATSQAVLSDLSFAIVADNTYTGAILNIGWVASIILLCFICGSYFVFRNKLLFVLLLGYSMTTVIFEISPVIHLLMLIFGMHAMSRLVPIKK